jgi:uncharacterized YigZ family protein
VSTSYPIPASTVKAEQTIKQSRFICYLGHGKSIIQIREEVHRIRHLHPRASHVCWAYIAGPPQTTEKGQSDDGEPRGTAGRPMLSVLECSGYGEIWTAVVRYFGGVKLGKGGLVRAYSTSLQRTLGLVETVTRQTLLHFRLDLDYNLQPVIERLCLESGVEIIQREYSDCYSVELLVPETVVNSFQQALKRVSNGSVRLHRDN